ncbi:hypothetical protein MVEN_02186800 [Mycena venus]|uniref:C2H2-type domain-containing protein n=1 Tax=Mycena venus TaxID=2733690 RepID=A0A8H6X967_9AGAR|nr:hypothetical protein MVEN_02186800 [Mycena venus]
MAAFNLRYVDYPASPDREFPCDLCPLSFDRHHDLKRHIETHSGEKPYLCDRGCGKAFTRKDALKRHQTTFPFCPPVRGPPRSSHATSGGPSSPMYPPSSSHPTAYGEGSTSSHYAPGLHPVPPYGGPTSSTWNGPPMPSEYGRRSSVPHYPSPQPQYGGPAAAPVKHEPGMSPPLNSLNYAPSFVPPPQHGGDFPATPSRPYPCDACPLSFERHHDLKRHKVTHVGERPYVCNGGCEKTFTRKDALKRHQVFCSASFSLLVLTGAISCRRNAEGRKFE